MNFAQSILIYFIQPILTFVMWCIVIEVIMSWLVAFNIINLRNSFVNQIYYLLRMITRPILDPIRRILPSMGGLDLSPIVAILFLSWLSGYALPSLLRVLG